MMTWTLYGTDGTEVPLSDCTAGTIHLGVGPTGLFGLPPVEFSSVPSPTLSAGSRRGDARYRERLIALDLVIRRDTPEEVDEDIALVASLINPQHGDCRLVVSTPTDSYDLVITYTSGWQIGREHGQSKHVSARCTFRAHDPWWRALSTEEQIIDFPVTGSGITGTDWDVDDDWDADLDWDGFDAGADGSTIVAAVLSSTAPAWPRWEIAGPATRVELHNATTGLSFDWEGNLETGQILSVGMAEDDRHVRVDGVDAWVGLSDESRMWYLKPGRPGAPQPNTVLVKLTGADTSSAAVMTYQPAWQSPQ